MIRENTFTALNDETLLQASCRTENGALSFPTTGDARLDLFFKTVRGINVTDLYQLIEKSWEMSKRDTLRTMFYVRDCRGGKGEKKIFWYFMIWLWDNHREYFMNNIHCVPHYGSFKDLKRIIESKDGEKDATGGCQRDGVLSQTVISFWCDVIKKDIESMDSGSPISLAAKWIPIQDTRFCKEMGLTHKNFRKAIRALRDKLDIVECKMSANEWEKITFERVCSLSMKKYSASFKKHCEERFSEYLKSVKKGEKKMNVSQLYPSDISKEFLNQPPVASCDEETLNIAWEQLLLKTRKNLSSKFLCVVDTSGSMNGMPLQVAVSLGLFLSELYPESTFYRKFITFSNSPKLQTAEGNTLKERIMNISKSEWSMNTDLQKVFDLILSSSKPEDHPDVLIILSDMQFDEAVKEDRPQCWGKQKEEENENKEEITNLAMIEEKYKKAGIKRPKLIFWNLREGTVDFPANTSTPDCALVSGYSPSILETLLETGDITPMNVFRRTIDSCRYDMVYTS